MKPNTNVAAAISRAVAIAIGLLLAGAVALSAPALAAPDEPAAAPPATVTIAHFAPFTNTITGTAVTVRVNGSDVIPFLVFGEKIPGIALPGGNQTVELIPSGGGAPVLTATLTLSGGVDYFVAAIGGANGRAPELYTLINDTAPLTASAKVRITHLAPFAPPGNPDPTTVDICTEAGVPVPGLTGIAYKDTSGYLPLAPGIYDLKIAAAGTGCTGVLDLPPFGLAVGQVVDAFAIGLLTPPDPALQLRIDQDGLVARARFAHFAPFASEVISTAVTWSIASSDLFTEVVFPQITPYLELPLGAYPVEVIPSGTTTPAITGTAVLSGWLDYTFAAIGDGINQPLELLRLVDDNVTPPAAGSARLRLGHLAPFANTLEGTKVDVCPAGGGAPLLDDIVYKQFGILNLPAGVHTVYIAAPDPDCALPLVSVPPFIVAAGQVAYAYAVGDLINLPPTVVTDPVLSVNWLYLPVVSKK